MRDAVAILRNLVAIPSVSSQSNRTVIEYATLLFEEAGWTCRQLSYRDGSGVEKVNLVATPAPQESATIVADLAFVCHTDTVPFAESWTEATRLVERDANLHGCGACDVKGAMAGILAAVSSVVPGQIKSRVAVVLTADEEVGCLGATRLLESVAIAAKRVVICEPTSLQPARAGKGYGLARVRVIGKEAHSAFPQQGASAIFAAARLIQEIERRLPELQVSRNELFDPPHTTVNVGTVHGGTAKNIIAGECTFLVEWRPIPGEDPRFVGEAIEGLAAAVTTSCPDCSFEAEVLRAEPGFESSAESGLVRKLTSLTGNAATGIPFGSEATRFARVAEEIVVLGPGDMRTAHSDREKIERSELMRWVDCVRALLVSGV